jgi:hypothetical protein
MHVRYGVRPRAAGRLLTVLSERLAGTAWHAAIRGRARTSPSASGSTWNCWICATTGSGDGWPRASRRRSAPSPDSYVSVFFEEEQRRGLREVIDATGASRDLD